MQRVQAPEIDGGAAWLNGGPLTLAELRGQLVLLHFWTSGRIECVHSLQILRAVEEALQGEPLVVIGVHSGRFPAEASLGHVHAAIARHGVRHPVVVDGALALARRYTIPSWPTLVLIAPDGALAAFAPGEPEEARLVEQLRAELAAARRAGTLATAPSPRARTEVTPGGALAFPGKVSLAPDGRVAIADSGHHRVLVCSGDGRVLARAGSGRRGFVDGAAADAAFAEPQGVAWRQGRVLVCDAGNHALRELDVDGGQVTTLAGCGRLGAMVARPPTPGRQAELRSPWDVAVDGDRVYVAMAGAHQLYVYDYAAGTIALFAGAGSEGRVDGAPGRAAFAQPSGLWLDRARGRLYVVDAESSSLRVVRLPDGHVETLVGAGLFDFGDVDGPAATARLQRPLGVCGRARHGRVEILVADSYNGKVKLVEEAAGDVAVRTVASGLDEPGGLCVGPDGRLWIADSGRHAIAVLDGEFAPAPPFVLGD
jgi:sugar lactone lactonase YvrE